MRMFICASHASHVQWDFGVITTDGIDSDVDMVGVNVADTKFAGVLILRRNSMTAPAEVSDMLRQ